MIICLPIACYEDVNFSPKLPLEKSHALSCLNPGTTEKHILVFDKVFWGARRYIFIYFSCNAQRLSFHLSFSLSRPPIFRFMITDLDISFTSMEKSTNSPLLYCWISRKNPYYNADPQFFAEIVTKCWKPEEGGELVEFIRSDWGGDEWSKGSFLSPGLFCFFLFFSFLFFSFLFFSFLFLFFSFLFFFFSFLFFLTYFHRDWLQGTRGFRDSPTASFPSIFCW